MGRKSFETCHFISVAHKFLFCAKATGMSDRNEWPYFKSPRGPGGGPVLSNEHTHKMVSQTISSLCAVLLSNEWVVISPFYFFRKDLCETKTHNVALLPAWCLAENRGHWANIQSIFRAEQKPIYMSGTQIGPPRQQTHTRTRTNSSQEFSMKKAEAAEFAEDAVVSVVQIGTSRKTRAFCFMHTEQYSNKDVGLLQHCDVVPFRVCSLATREECSASAFAACLEKEQNTSASFLSSPLPFPPRSNLFFTNWAKLSLPSAICFLPRVSDCRVLLWCCWANMRCCPTC